MSADDIARAIIFEGRKRNVSRKGICIALTVPFVETGYRNLANPVDPATQALPNDGLGTDHDSAGVMQQRIAWGPAACRMDPHCSAGLFYDGGQAGQPGLLDQDYDSDRQSPGLYAADVQQPQKEYRDRYDKFWDQANALYDRLSGPEIGVPRANVELAKQVFTTQLLGKPYVYGELDCSKLVNIELEALTKGAAMSWARTVNTESWPPNSPPGARGPYGTIRADSLHAIPADAVAKIPIKHGGGGANSHMEVEVDGMLMEAGDPVCTRPDATPLDDPQWTDYWFLPGPIAGGVADPDAFPLPFGYFYGPLEGSDASISGRYPGEPQYWRDGLGRWQSLLGLPVTKVWDAATAAAAEVLQHEKGWPQTVAGEPPKLIWGTVHEGEWDWVVRNGWRLPGPAPVPVPVPVPVPTPPQPPLPVPTDVLAAVQAIFHEVMLEARIGGAHTRPRVPARNDRLLGHVLSARAETRLTLALTLAIAEKLGLNVQSIIDRERGDWQ